MLTRCPHCETTFRVGPEQLKARQGKVRCGECRAVFDALDALIDDTPVTATAAPRTIDDVAPVSDDPSVPSEPTEATVISAGTEPDEGQTDTARDTRPEPASAADILHADPEPAAPLEASALSAPVEPISEPEPLTEPLPAPVEAISPWPPDEWVQDTAPGEARRWPWALGALTLLVLAVGQLLFMYRTELAMQAPELRPLFASACDWLGCEMPYPRKGDLITIETSDLAPEGRDRLQLSATLKNRATFVQAYPYLELTLTDSHDDPILRKVLAPEDYLLTGKPSRGGFAARGELAVKLLLDVKDVPAAGYRLYLFYP